METKTPKQKCKEINRGLKRLIGSLKIRNGNKGTED